MSSEAIRAKIMIILGFFIIPMKMSLTQMAKLPIASGTHRKSPSIVRGIAAVPLFAAVAEAEDTRQRRILYFIRQCP